MSVHHVSIDDDYAIIPQHAAVLARELDVRCCNTREVSALDSLGKISLISVVDIFVTCCLAQWSWAVEVESMMS